MTVKEFTNGEYIELAYDSSRPIIKGDFVAKLRDLLARCQLATMTPSSTNDPNEFDSSIESSIRSLQQKVGVPATGILNDATLNAIISYANAKSPIEIEDNSPEETTDTEMHTMNPHYDSFFDTINTKEHRRNHKDIKIVFGDGTITKTIKDIFMRSSSVEVDTSGNPISEVYEFIARDIYESDEELDTKKYNNVEANGGMASSSDIKYVFNV